MKEFAVFIWVLIFGTTLMVINGCTSFQLNSDGIKRACKSGVESYDDGSTSFKCQTKQLTHEQGGKQ